MPKKPSSDPTEVKLSAKEVDFLRSNELCRFATASRKGEPHVVPVSYVWDQDHAYVVTDYGTRKLKNLRENPHAAVLVDSAGTQKFLLLSGSVEIIEKGEESRRLYKLFYSKLSWVKRDPWKEGEAPFIKVTPSFKAGWGLKGLGRQIVSLCSDSSYCSLAVTGHAWLDDFAIVLFLFGTLRNDYSSEKCLETCVSAFRILVEFIEHLLVKHHHELRQQATPWRFRFATLSRQCRLEQFLAFSCCFSRGSDDSGFIPSPLAGQGFTTGYKTL